MATDAQILRAAYQKEHMPGRLERWKPWAWEAWAVNASKEDLKRLRDNGYITEYGETRGHTLYVLTPRGTTRGEAEVLERKMAAPDYRSIITEMDGIVGFDDIKETLARAVSSQKKINFLLQGPPACAKSLLLDAIKSAAPAPYSYEAFGSRTSSAGLSDVLFEMSPQILLFDELDKMDGDCYAICLGLMEKGEVVETKKGNIRSEHLDCMVIGACNSSAKMSREFLSRFAAHFYFPEYTRDEFIEVCVGMLARTHNFNADIATIIGASVYDRQLGDVRRARGVADLMMEPSVDEVERSLTLIEKYRLPAELEEQNKKIQSKRFKRQSQAQLPM
jgi:replication-associated recombination protein RarA